MSESYIAVDLNDSRTGLIAEAISNKTCKKILSLLAEKEMSEGDIAEALGTGLNTVEYNLKKLIEAGLIVEAKNYFWSRKGKRIRMYKIVNKKIVIFPKSILKGMFPAIIGALMIAIGIKMYFDKITNKPILEDFADKTLVATTGNSGFAESLASGAGNSILVSYAWAWFLLGALAALLIFIVWNWKKYD